MPPGGLASLASSAQLLERPACPMCRGTEAHTAFDFPPFAVVRCAACAFVFLSPRLMASAMRGHYAGDAYFDGAGYEDYLEQRDSLVLTFSRLLRTMRSRHLVGGALLEVGCGHGLFLRAAAGNFTRREGTEYSAKAAALARVAADSIYLGGLENVPAGNRYRCIVATQVIEHVYDPEAFLGDVMAHLEPGGALVVTTPDFGGLLRRVTGRSWPSFKIPEHVLYFDRVSLARLLRRCGFADVRELPAMHAFPISLLARKVGLRLPQLLGRCSLFVPTTTLGMSARKPSDTAGTRDG